MTAQTPDAGTPGSTPAAADDQQQAPAPSALDAPQDGGEDDTEQPEGKRAQRQRAQDAEAQSTALAARVESLTRSAIDAQLPSIIAGTAGGARHLHNPADFWAVGGHNTTDFVDDDGTVDAGKLTAAVEKLSQEKPYLFAAGAQSAPRTHVPATTQDAWRAAMQKARSHS